MRSVRLNRVFRRDPVGGGPASPLAVIKSVPIIGYYRADFYTLGTGVNAWLDQSGNGNHLTQGTVANQPTPNASVAAFNNQPAFTFDGVNDDLTGAFAVPAPGTTPRYYWLVCAQLTWTSNMGICGAGGSLVQSFFMQPSTPNVRAYNGVVSASNTNLPVGTARMCEISFSNSVADFLKVGSQNQTGVNLGNGSAASWSVGSYTGSGWGNVQHADLLITTGVPSGAERALLAAYASTRYGAGVIA
jgi:hypothetical protein